MTAVRVHQWSLIAQFLADPTEEPDAACIDEMTPAWVLPE